MENEKTKEEVQVQFGAGINPELKEALVEIAKIQKEGLVEIAKIQKEAALAQKEMLKDLLQAIATAVIAMAEGVGKDNENGRKFRLEEMKLKNEFDKGKIKLEHDLEKDKMKFEYDLRKDCKD